MITNHSKPVKSLKTFTSKIIDYAGLFPPASLELAQAFHNFVFYSQSEYRDMLSKFIIPANRLPELTSIMNGMNIDGKIPFSIIGSGGETLSEYNDNLLSDVELIRTFIEKFKDTAAFDAMELRLPEIFFEPEHDGGILDVMTNVSERLKRTFEKETPVYYEANLKKDYEERIIRVVESIAGLESISGFKLRTGGIVADAFPSPEQIAFAIMACCEFEVPMKCTAGLHHPIRHFNDGVSSYMHGFFNVFGAAIMAYTNNLDENELLDILNDEDPYEFMFKKSGFEYNEIEVSNEEIKEAREKFIMSYGSCSFDEPIDDLKTMELL